MGRRLAAQPRRICSGLWQVLARIAVAVLTFALGGPLARPPVATASPALAGALVERGAGWIVLPPPNAPKVLSPTREGHTAVWTGQDMIVWGGFYVAASNLGGRYHPATDAWTALPTEGAPGPRSHHAAVWTGTEVLVWGGWERSRDGHATAFGDGAAYNPATSTWRRLSTEGAPHPRAGHTAVWTGSEMVIWGGTTSFGGPYLNDGARYDPRTDRWTPMSSSTLSPRAGHTAVWTGRELLVWGGDDGSGALGDGARYDPATDRWSLVSAAGAPSPRSRHTAVWTGSEMVIWGGHNGGRTLEDRLVLGDGARYRPAVDVWSPMPAEGAPAPRAGHTAVWTGTELLVWGGSGGPRGPLYLSDGARYSPAVDVWAPLPAAGAPSPRAGHTAVWTGTELLVWGGIDGGSVIYGGRYRPSGAPLAPHDARYFLATRYRIDNDAFWAYYEALGGVSTFGFPVSRAFPFLGCAAQVFQRQLLQQCGAGAPVRPMNLLDPDLMPYHQINFSVFPAHDPQVAAAAPPPGTPNYGEAVLRHVQGVAPDVFEGLPVRFFATFVTTVPGSNPQGDPDLAAALNLEVWGFPTSRPAFDPTNRQFVYQRFQRGIMHFDAASGATQGILLADYFKGILVGQPGQPNLPPDLAAQAATSRYFRQYCPGQPCWVCRPDALPGTDLTFAFEPQ
jgi:N-acetylneuraminic acid mutarotase